VVGSVAAKKGAPTEGGPSLDDYKEGKEAAADAKAAAAASQAKMAAVDKVMTLLTNLKAKVIEEGEAEAKTYNEFACFCKDTISEKNEAIQRGSDEKQTLSSSIEALATARDEMDTTIQDLVETIAKEEATVKAAQVERATQQKEYDTNAADMTGAVSALTAAIAAMKASKSPSLAQLQSISSSLRAATAMADALGFGDHKKVSSFFQADEDPEVAMEDYKFHSGGIIATLEGLLTDFKAEKNSIDAAEVTAVHSHDSLMQEKTDLLKQKNKEMDDSKAEKAKKQEEIATNSQQLSTVSAVLLDDQQYLAELSALCANKATTYDSRIKVRADEISALSAAIDIIGSTVSEKTAASTIRFAQSGVAVKLAEAMAKTPAAMEAAEADAEAFEDGQTSFVQRGTRAFLAPVSKASSDYGRDQLVKLFASKGASLKSELLTSLASQVGADPLAKVKVMIQELIERLLSQASNEENHKGWCDKSMADAAQKRDYASAEVEKLNSDMATLEATRDKLAEELGTLGQELITLTNSMEEAGVMRTEESTQNSNTVLEANAGLDAVKQAITILDHFYKAAAKGNVASLAQQPSIDAPDAGFKNDEAYTGAQGASGGIVGMLQVIEGDFTRTISETEAAEAQAQQDHLQFMTDSGISKAEKTTAESQKTTQKDNAEQSLDTAEESMKSQMSTLTSSVKELLELKPACVDTGMSYEERVMMREEELAALKKGMCILENYANYGPNAGFDDC